MVPLPRSRERLPSLFACFLLLALLSSASALTREQAEQIDWSKKNVGSVSHAHFVRRPSSTLSPSPASASDDALLVASAEAGSIALLDAADGEIVWRKILDGHERLLEVVPLGRDFGAALSLSATPSSPPLLRLRAWRPSDGALLWDRPLGCDGDGPSAPSASASSSSDGSLAFVACGGRATAFDAATGSRRWSVQVPPASSYSLSSSEAPDSSVLASWASPSELGVAALRAEDGTAVDGGGAASKKVPSSARPLRPSSVSTAASGVAAALSLDGTRICAVSAGSGSDGVRCASLPSEAGDCSGARLTSSSSSSRPSTTLAAVACSEGVAVVSLSEGGALSPTVREFLRGATAGGVGGGSYAGVASAPPSSSEGGAPPSPREAAAVDVLSPLFPACDSSSPRRPPPSSVPRQLVPARAWLGSVVAPSGSSSPTAASAAVVVATRDGTLSLSVSPSPSAEGGGDRARSPPLPLWVRHEGLSKVDAASVAPLFVPLPPEPTSEGGKDPASSPSDGGDGLPFSSLARLEWLAARSHLPLGAASLSLEEASELRQLRSRAARRGSATSDARGFRQAALLLSDSGTLYAVHTGDGAVLWRADGVAEEKRGGREAKGRAVLHWRAPSSSPPSSASPPSSSPSSSSSSPLVAVFSGESYSVVDAFTGAVVSRSEPLPFAPRKVVELPGTGTRERPESAFLLVGEATSSDGDDGPRVSLFPRTEATLEAALAVEGRDSPSSAPSSPIRFWLEDAEGGTLTGYVVSDGGEKGGSGDGGDLERRLARSSSVSWRHAFGESSLLAVAAPSQRHDAAPSAAAKVLGDRSMKLRLAPGSLLFVATANGDEGDDDVEGDGGGGSPPPTSGITASILDAVSGQFVFRQVHRAGSGPVLATWAENAVYYHFAEVKNVKRGDVESDDGASSSHSDVAADGTPAPSPPRWLVGSMELYDLARGRGLSAGALAAGALRGLLPSERGGGKGPASSTHSQSSFAPPPAEVLRATFSVPHPASTLSTTSSARGVAARWLLLGTGGAGSGGGGEVFAFDRRWLDPRRPVGGPASPGSPEALEGLPPYHPDLPVIQGMSPTHGSRVESGGVAAVAAAPASLESTCLLLVVGGGRGGRGGGRGAGVGDLFGTRVQPAGGFDALPPDFPFGLLLAATAATLAGAAALRVAADREALKQQWA